MQPAGNITDLFSQAVFYVDMNIFQLFQKLESTLLDFFPDFSKALLDGIRIFRINDSLLGKHSDVSDAPGNVLCVKPLVERYGGIEPGEKWVHSRVKTAFADPLRTF
jgi:hypothetical protein